MEPFNVTQDTRRLPPLHPPAAPIISTGYAFRNSPHFLAYNRTLILANLSTLFIIWPPPPSSARVIRIILIFNFFANSVYDVRQNRNKAVFSVLKSMKSPDNNFFLNLKNYFELKFALSIVEYLSLYPVFLDWISFED